MTFWPRFLLVLIATAAFDAVWAVRVRATAGGRPLMTGGMAALLAILGALTTINWRGDHKLVVARARLVLRDESHRVAGANQRFPNRRRAQRRERRAPVESQGATRSVRV